MLSLFFGKEKRSFLWRGWATLRPFICIAGWVLLLTGCAERDGNMGISSSCSTSREESKKDTSSMVAVAAGDLYTVALKADGTVQAWGWNEFGQIGDGTTTFRRKPVTVKGPDGDALGDVTAIAAGKSHTAVVKNDGTIWTWGDNTYGQLGDGTRDASFAPVQVKAPSGEGVLTGIVAIAVGEAHTVALRPDGTVLTWGSGRSGELGSTNKTNIQTLPVPVNGPEGKGLLSGIQAIAAGRKHTVALKQDGTVWSWGANYNGQLGDGTTQSQNAPVQVVGPDGSGELTGIVAIAASAQRHSFTAALDRDGAVWTWGRNYDGQLGDGTTFHRRSVPGRVVAPDGRGWLTGIVDVAVSGTHGIAQRGDGTLWAWGGNRFGQLGDGTTLNRLTPVQVALPAERFKHISVGERHAVAVRADGTVVAWGNNWYGQLGGFAQNFQVKPKPFVDSGEGIVLWTTSDRLMPQWGFYPNGQAYGGVKPLSEPAAWTLSENTITWVADLPMNGQYHIWVRKVYGRVDVTVDERQPSGAKGGPSGKYAWLHQGVIELDAGTHHIDAHVKGQCMFDAILLSTSSTFKPDVDPLPEPVEQPIAHAPRHYRDDAQLRVAVPDRPFALGHLRAYGGNLNDWLPSTNDLLTGSLKVWGAANQYVNGSFGIRAFEPIPEMEVSLKKMTGPEGRVIEQADIDLRVVYIRERVQQLFSWESRPKLVPELLLRDDRTQLPPEGHQGGYGGGHCQFSVPAGESRQIWMTVHVPPGYPAGIYVGEMVLQSAKGAYRQNVEIEVLPVDLKAVDGYYSIYHPVRPVMSLSGNGVSESRYAAELKDMVRHGLNTVSLYGGFDTLHFARDAGMTEAPCIMGWPGGSGSLEHVEAAKAMGFKDLLFYGVDEPVTAEAVERCRKEAVRRSKLGLKMLTAISVPKSSWEALKDVIDYPVLIMPHYSGKNAAEPMYAREKGFTPLSYWMTSSTFPMLFRSYAGLYNTACGYLGTMPWSYTDYADPMRKYDPGDSSHQVTYPDENGLPIPTLQWEAYRDGIDDVRYLQMLVRAINVGKQQLKQPGASADLATAVKMAEDVYEQRFESIDGLWYRYLIRSQIEDLDATRRDFADAVVRINACLND